MEELTNKLDLLRIRHELKRIDEIVDKLKKSYYVSSETRNRIVNFLRYIIYNMADDPVQSVSAQQLTYLERIFSKSSSNYITRDVARQTI